MLQLQLSEATAARRRIPLHLVDATDGITPETGESAGQPQISKNGGAFANTTATLTAIANGAYYVELTATELDTVGFAIVRYKSANTAEAQVAFQVVAHDVYDATRLGLTALPNAAADAAGGLPISDAGGLDLDALNTNINDIETDTNELQADWTNGGRLDLIIDSILALLDDPRTEPGQGAPPVNPDLATKIDYLYKSWRNKKDNDGSTTNLYADDGTTVDHKQTTSESGGTVTKAEWITGA